MRYLIGFLIVIGFIVLVFSLILHGVTSHGTTSTSQPLVTYANTGTTVRLTIDGPINADQSHYQLQMTVGQGESELVLYKGYVGDVTKSFTYNNNSASYGEFLRALQIDGFAKGDTGKSADSDPRGYCAIGERFTYEIIAAGHDSERFWSTSCGGQGTFKGSTVAVNNLFIAQMPDYSTAINNTDIF